MGLLEFMVHCAVTWAQFFMSAATLTLRTLVSPLGQYSLFVIQYAVKRVQVFTEKKVQNMHHVCNIYCLKLVIHSWTGLRVFLYT